MNEGLFFLEPEDVMPINYKLAVVQYAVFIVLKCAVFTVQCAVKPVETLDPPGDALSKGTSPYVSRSQRESGARKIGTGQYRGKWGMAF